MMKKTLKHKFLTAMFHNSGGFRRNHFASTGSLRHAREHRHPVVGDRGRHGQATLGASRKGQNLHLNNSNNNRRQYNNNNNT